MRITTKLVMQWDDKLGQFVTLERVSKDYYGPVESCCGATDGMKDIAGQQSSFATQLVSQASSVFGAASKVFNDLVRSFSPTLAAGPNQQGFSAQENANLQAKAVNDTGQAYKNAKAAVGNAQAAKGGGNTALTSGAEVGTDLGLAESAANQTAGELGQINEANYEVGRDNYKTAVAGMESAPNVFGAATNAANAATNAQEGAATTQNLIAQENQSWVQGVTGALGGVAGAFMTGGMGNLGKGVGFFGQNAPPPGQV